MGYKYFRSNEPGEPDEYLDAYELAEILGMNICTIYSLCRKGVVPAKKLGRQWRISRRELEKYMEYPL